ncbi:hypothetical protein BDZ89DRAFT_1048370 [Hymenopellis radicata]|nr:hypothetical protein BDZ89DRAFT_1048370 [Hymenopellis radicata]
MAQISLPPMAEHPNKRSPTHFDATRKDCDYKGQLETLKKKSSVDLRREKRKDVSHAETKSKLCHLEKDVIPGLKCTLVATESQLAQSEQAKLRLEELVARQQLEIGHVKKALKVCMGHKDKLQKRVRRHALVLVKAVQRARDQARKQGVICRLHVKGIYTRRACALARRLIKAGCSERSVGKVIQDVGAALGIRVPDCMSRTQVQRIESEGGMMTDIQVGHAIAMGEKLAVDHTVETQISGLNTILTQTTTAYSDSPLAERVGKTAHCDDFFWKLRGSGGDHASDVKKHQRVLDNLKEKVTLERLGAEMIASKTLEPVEMIQLILKARDVRIRKMGMEKFEGLSSVEREHFDRKVDSDVERALGKEVLASMPQEDRRKLTMFIRGGCCMHKDLNTCKGQKPSAAASRAAQVTKCGAVHAAMLGGLICHHKDDKKGQQNNFDWFFSYELGHTVVYPGTSSTRYHSNCDAASVIVKHRETFIDFMEHVRESKEKPGLTNVEKNFLTAIQDLCTLTEFCVLILYSLAIGKPWLLHVRGADGIIANYLELGPMHRRLREHFIKIIDDPDLLLGENVSHETAVFDGMDWHDVEAFNAVRKLAPQLPHLRRILVAFMKSALVTYDRFTPEFREDGLIASLTKEERKAYYMVSTNDGCEGDLGSFRVAKRTSPSISVHQQRAHFMHDCNNTAKFAKKHLNIPADDDYIRHKGKERLEEKTEKKRKERHVVVHKAKVQTRKKKRDDQAEKKTTYQGQLLRAVLIISEDKVRTLTNNNLCIQLDIYREYGKDRQIPLKTHLKNKALLVAALLAALVRMRDFGEADPRPECIDSEVDGSGDEVVEEAGSELESESEGEQEDA